MTKRRAIRVLINGLHAKSGGGITYLVNILPKLAEDPDLDLHLFLHTDQFDILMPIDERVRVHVLDFQSSFLRLLLWEQFCLPILARTMNVDVTFSPANYGPLAAPRPIILLRNSLAVAGRETRLGKRLYWAALAFMTLASLLAARRSIAVSNYARNALTLGLGKMLGDRVRVIPHGVSEIFSPPATVRAQTDRYLLVVADIYIQKNLHTLIRVMGRLRARYPDLTLRIAGTPVDPEYYQELRQIISEYDLHAAVFFLGKTPPEELRELYRNCTVFVFPSTVEAFGNPLAEAMACGAAIATSRTAAMPEIVGDAAEYFDPLNSDEIAAAICRIIDSPALRDELGRKGLKRVRLFSWRTTAERTAALLKEAAAGTP